MTTLREIMIVDDNEADRFLHRELLDEMGVTAIITEAIQGQAALDLLLQRQTQIGSPMPDLILLDINMPIMDGWEFLRLAMRAGLLNDTTVAMMRGTSLLAGDAIEHDTAFQPDVWTDKPLVRDAVLEILDGMAASPHIDASRR